MTRYAALTRTPTLTLTLALSLTVTLTRQVQKAGGTAYKNLTSCDPCPAGTYQDDEGQVPALILCRLDVPLTRTLTLTLTLTRT